MARVTWRVSESSADCVWNDIGNPELVKFIRCVILRPEGGFMGVCVKLDLATAQRGNDIVIDEVISRWWMMHRPMPVRSAKTPVRSVRRPPPT
jgi:hypothetical protein